MTDHTADSHAVRLELQSGYRFRAIFGEDLPGFVTDEPPPLGTGAGPDPSALLAASVGNCLASSFLFCVRKARIEPAGLDVEVRVFKKRDEHGRLRIGHLDVHLIPHLEETDRARLGRCLDLYESFCVVTESVRQAFPVNVLLEPRTVAKVAGRDESRPPREAVALPGSRDAA